MSPAADKAGAARAEALLAQGVGLIDELGHRAGLQAAKALAELDKLGATSSELMNVNSRMVPLITSLKGLDGRSRWRRWFTGAALELDVFLPRTRTEIEALAEAGELAHARLLGMAKVFESQRTLMAVELDLLDEDIAAGRVLVSAPYAARCRQAGFDDDAMARLARRVANLEASAVAARLSAEQYKIAVTHGRAVADRFSEIRTLLLPIWKQAMGFELFGQRLSNPSNP